MNPDPEASRQALLLARHALKNSDDVHAMQVNTLGPQLA